MFRFLTFSSLQPSLKRSSGESTIFFTSLPFSRMVQKILPSMLHTLCVDGSWRRIRAILARRGVRSSLIYTPFLLPASRNLRLFFMMVVLVFRRTNLTMIGRVLPGRPLRSHGPNGCQKQKQHQRSVDILHILKKTTPPIDGSAASRKITERRLKWYGHVMRMEEDRVVRRVMTKAIPGERKRGRPKTRGKDVCKRDMQTVRLREGDEGDRAYWKETINNHSGDPR